MESEAQDDPGADDAAVLSRIEQALERIGQLAHPDRPRMSAPSDIAGRLDDLIEKLRHALADRLGEE